jgi:undecaprenyl diphosphate synthase
MDNEYLPQHIAIIMDGNGRWASRLGKTRQIGHDAGSKVVLDIVKACIDHEIEVLTLFAFSSENWQRPNHEVSFLMGLFLSVLKKEMDHFHKHQIQFRVIGDRADLPGNLIDLIEDVERTTAENKAIVLQVAFSYGGRWDITQSLKKIAGLLVTNKISYENLSEELIAQHLSFSGLPDVDLLIRTGGELRLSNFILWQAAYSELYFTDILWPEFSPVDLTRAIQEYSRRQRRFGLTGEQVTT